MWVEGLQECLAAISRDLNASKTSVKINMRQRGKEPTDKDRKESTSADASTDEKSQPGSKEPSGTCIIVYYDVYRPISVRPNINPMANAID